MQDITLRRANGQTLHLTPMGTNALCAIEEAWGKVFGQLLIELGVFGETGWSLTTTRLVLQACATEKLSLEEWGEVIDELGFDGISKAVNGLIGPAQARELVHA